MSIPVGVGIPARAFFQSLATTPIPWPTPRTESASRHLDV